MADTADLTVLGAYYGTGNKGRTAQDTKYTVGHTIWILLCILIGYFLHTT